MKTLADLKRRIKPGLTLTLIDRKEARLSRHDPDLNKSVYSPLENKPVPPESPLFGPRTVTHVDTTGFYMSRTPEDGKRGSFCGFPKATELDIISDNTFTIYANDRNNPWLALTYKIHA